MQEYISKSTKQTQKIATTLAKKIKGGEVLCFYGDLGAGKTTFIQAFAKALGVKENITSPTFVLMKKYPFSAKATKGKPHKMNFYHMDAYRLSDPQEALDLGLEEIWEEKENVIAIEWADKINDILPWKKIDICFSHEGDEKRKITIFD